MTEADKIGYLANLDRQLAQDSIHQGRINWDNPESVRRLFLLAFGDEAKATAAWRIAQDHYVDKKMQEAKR